MYIKKGKASISDIGGIIYRKYDDFTTPSNDLQVAVPYDNNFVNLPTINERVQIFTTAAGRFYKRLNISL